jgi:hypothetical protein
LREKVNEVLARPEYAQADREASTAMLEFWQRTLEWGLVPLRWMFEMTQGLPDVIRWLIVGGLTLMLVVLVIHLVWTFHRAVMGASMARRDVALELEEQVHRRPEDVEALVRQVAADGDWIGAVRLLLVAALLRLEQREERPFRRGMTNRQHLKRYRNSQVFEPLQTLVRTIELKWFGDEVCEQVDYDACRQAHGTLCSLLAGGVHADAA